MIENGETPEIYKDYILQKLREKGCRITRQRELILDVILENEFSSCKELCFYVEKLNKNIGQATVYRMVNTLEEIGVINRKSIYISKNILK